MREKERKEVKEMIKEAVWEALTAEITLEKRKDEKTGLPLAHPEIKQEKIFLPAFLVQILHQNEGAFRGLQEDLGKSMGAIRALAVELDKVVKAQEALAGVLLSIEEFCRSHPEILQLNTVKFIEDRKHDS